MACTVAFTFNTHPCAHVQFEYSTQANFKCACKVNTEVGAGILSHNICRKRRGWLDTLPPLQIKPLPFPDISNFKYFLAKQVQTFRDTFGM